MPYRPLHRQWRSTSAMWYTMIVEVAVVITCLVVFALAQPDNYRTMMWRAGYEMGFNSSPNIILYSKANFTPFPDLPFVWTQTLTDFNVAISVLGLFLLLAKLIAFLMGVFYPIVATFIYLAMVAMYAASVGGQAGPDYLDPEHPSAVAWYIAKPCTVSPNWNIQDACRFVKGMFTATVVMLCVYLVNLGLSVWAMMPTEADKRPAGETSDDDDDDDSSPTYLKNKSWEMHNMPATPATGNQPFTPRTTAFRTLERRGMYQ